MGKDYYKILDVDKNADEDTLKKAYRKLGKVDIFLFRILLFIYNKNYYY